MSLVEKRARLAFLENLTHSNPRRLTAVLTDERNQLFRDLRAEKKERIMEGRSFAFSIPPGFTFTISDRPAHGYEVFLSLDRDAPGANASAKGDDIQALIDQLVPEVLAKNEANLRKIEEGKAKLEAQRKMIREAATKPSVNSASGDDLLAELGL